MSTIDWQAWDFDGDVPGGTDARAVVNGIVLEAYDDGSWAVDDEISEDRCTGDNLESAKADCAARLQDGPPYGVNFDRLGASSAPTAFAFGAEQWPGLAKLNEEAGEVVQIIGKLMMTYGAPAHWDGTDLKQRLQDEVADLAAAVDFVIMHCGFDEAACVTRAAAKLKLFEEWHAQSAPKQPRLEDDYAQNPEEQCEHVAEEGSLSWGNRCMLKAHVEGAHVYGTPLYERGRRERT